MRLAARSFAAAVLTLAAVASHAQVAVSTFGPGDSFRLDAPFHEIASIGPTGGYRATSVSFFSGASGQLSTIRLAAFTTFDHQPLRVGLYGYPPNLPMVLLEEFLVTPPAANGSIVTLASVVHPLLAEDGFYELRLSAGPSAGLSAYSWNYTDQGIQGFMKVQDAPDGPWTDVPIALAPAYEVTVTAAPEPASVALVATGLLALGGARTRARRARR